VARKTDWPGRVRIEFEIEARPTTPSLAHVPAATWRPGYLRGSPRYNQNLYRSMSRSRRQQDACNSCLSISKRLMLIVCTSLRGVALQIAVDYQVPIDVKLVALEGARNLELSISLDLISGPCQRTFQIEASLDMTEGRWLTLRACNRRARCCRRP
jgi:hypothetical protein